MQQSPSECEDTARIVFRVRKELSDPTHECLALIGSSEELGAWQDDRVVMANYIGMATWMVDIRIQCDCSVYYKWAVVHRATGEVRCLEGGDNRQFQVGNRMLLIDDEFDGDGGVTEF